MEDGTRSESTPRNTPDLSSIILGESHGTPLTSTSRQPSPGRQIPAKTPRRKIHKKVTPWMLQLQKMKNNSMPFLGLPGCQCSTLCSWVARTTVVGFIDGGIKSKFERFPIWFRHGQQETIAEEGTVSRTTILRRLAVYQYSWGTRAVHINQRHSFHLEKKKFLSDTARSRSQVIV